MERHYCESLFLGAHLPAGAAANCRHRFGRRVSRVFPLAILRPDCAVTLIESHQRKAVFLREASRRLPNVRVLAKRAEDVSETLRLGGLPRGELRGSGARAFRGLAAKVPLY